MTSNFQQHMGGPGQMMPQQRMPQQRPQSNQASMQIQQVIYNALNSQTGPLSGWQAQVLINERITLIFNIIGNLRLASQHQPNAPPLQKMVEIGIKFEKDIFERCATKDQYKHEVQVKLEQLLERRNQQQANLQQTIHQQAQAQAQAQQAQAQQMLMNQNMQGQGMGMPQQPGQQGFAHLQHPMQASQLPGQQSQQNAMGMQNQGLPQNPTQNQQQQFQMAMQQQQNQNQQSQNVTARPNGNQPSLSQQDNQLVTDLTNRLVAQTSEEDKNNIRARLRTQMDPASFQKCQAQGMDPIVLYFRQQAIGRLRAERSARAQQQLQLAQGQNMSGATPMQPQRSMQPSPAQPAAATAGNPDFSSFMGNMGDLAAQQQQQGVMAEQSGQIVVPASSGAPRNPTPQPGVMSGQGMNMNDQRGVANPNPRAQQMFNAQQLQHQRLQHAQAQQQQSQTQARLNAQKNAQQIALQGQPGGMGPGPVPQQSPAMQTLNAPMRTPSQQNNHAELPQANPNGQFGQPVDPRFMQGTQRQSGQGNGMNAAGLNPAMFANMGPGLPPDKLNEVVNKWNGLTNGPGGKPGMTMQGNPQARPGMPGQQVGQLNAQNQAAQFAMANGGQRPPPNMMGAMNAQQQMLLHQQMAALRPGQVPPRNMPPNVMQLEQRNLIQMDGADIPPYFINQPGMPQGFPPEVKKWGQMKQWVTQNPNLGPNALEGVKNFQRLHFQQIMQRSRQQHQPGAIPPNQGGMSGAMQTGGPGMAAPVAPMGPNPLIGGQGMQVPQLRQPTAQEILSIRNHVSGKLANATDEQIRHIFMNNQLKAQQQAQAQAQGQMNPQQQEQQRQLLNMQRLKQMQQQQNNGQQTQPGQASQPNMTSVQNQAKQIPTPPSKPATATSKPTTSSNTPNQAARPQPNARNTAQNASPAQPVNKLKRQNSDDVVEVPNPNTQLQQPPQAQSSNPKPQPKFTPQQVAQMTPEMRKRYEFMMRSNQLNAANGPGAIPAADQMKLKEISKQEEQDNQHSLQDIPMDADMKQKMRKILESIVGPLSNVSRVVGKWFQLTLDEDQARKFFRARYRLAKQFQDPQMQRPKDTFSIWPQEVEAARALLGNMVKDLTAKYPDLKKPNATKTQVQAQPSQPSQPAQPQTPLNAANLQQQQQQLNKLAHQRSNSRSSHTPAAPTSSQPPFQLGAKSPQGTPIYAPKNTIDVDKLHIPARKKQKHAPAPGQGTPGSNSSPQVAKAVSPEMKRQQQPEMKSQPKPTLCCQEPDCERHQVGFENEEELKKHTNEEHIGPLENPSKYVQESMTTVLGLDSQGQLKKPAAPAIQETAPKMAATNSKQGQTPIVKPGNTPSAATPMMRQASMNRQASANGIKPNMPLKGTPVKEVASKVIEQKDVKQAENKTPAPLEFNDPWADSMIDPNELFGVFQQFETGAGGSISDMNVFRGITPNDTPESSKDGVSEPNSDISDGVGLDINIDLFDSNWQPFGPSDTEGLNDMGLIIANDEDITMFDEEPSLGYATFDDIDTSMFEKPFSLDTALFSLDGN